MMGERPHGSAGKWSGNMHEDHSWELLTRVDAKVDALQHTVTAFIARQEEVCANQREKADRIYATMYGNGKPGLVETVRRLDEADAFRRKLVTASVALILTNIGTIVTFVWAFIKA